MSELKYNLRCDRIVSGKMLLKDFVYDTNVIPSGASRKKENRKPRVMTPRIPRPRGSVYPQRKCVVLLEKTEKNVEVQQQHEERVLNFKCNFCSEPIATLSSLSTHVKSHRREYCRICYWVVQDDESIDEHKNKQHNNTAQNTNVK